MNNYLNIAQIIISILLAAAILLQQRGGGLSSIFGGEGNFYSTRRGAEKFIFWASVILSILFLGVAFTQLLIK